MRECNCEQARAARHLNGVEIGNLKQEIVNLKILNDQQYETLIELKRLLGESEARVRRQQKILDIVTQVL